MIPLSRLNSLDLELNFSATPGAYVQEDSTTSEIPNSHRFHGNRDFWSEDHSDSPPSDGRSREVGIRLPGP